MTTFTGNIACGLCLLALLVFTAPALAVTATLDRDSVAMGDTMRLTITTTRDSEDLGDADLRPLMAEFEILQRSTRSSTSIINGERSHKRELVLEITPKREGLLTIPPMRVGAGATNLLQVTVAPASTVNTGGASVLFDAELDRQRVYVQGQVILTLRLQQAINLDNRSISELSLDEAFIKPLEQKSFQRTVDGRPWLVHEVRYAIFPEHSGVLTIPAQNFSAREAVGRRSLFDRGGNGRVIRLQTDPLEIEVRPRPDDYPPATWLPARALQLEENWSAAPDTLRAGESITRTITLRAEGLQGAQLPPVLFPAQEGVKFYPDQPTIEEREVSTGLEGRRVDSVALVPTREGELVLPEVRIPWWDVESGQLRHAVLPERRIPVAAASPTIATPQVAQPAPKAPVLEQAVVANGSAFPWHWLALASSAGWLLTLLWIFLQWRRQRRAMPAEQLERASETRAWGQLLAACASDSPAQARIALLGWVGALQDRRPLTATDQVDRYFRDADMARETAALNRALYAGDGESWQGQGLRSAAERLRKTHRQDRPAATRLELYPQPAAQGAHGAP